MTSKEGWRAGSHGAMRLLVTILMLAVVPIGRAQTPDTCPCSVWSSSAIPMTSDGGDGAATELGLRFRSDVTGYITGIRFYKAATNTGAHQVSLWTNTGTLLATGTSADESSSGWQEAQCQCESTDHGLGRSRNGHFAGGCFRQLGDTDCDCGSDGNLHPAIRASGRSTGGLDQRNGYLCWSARPGHLQPFFFDGHRDTGESSSLFHRGSNDGPCIAYGGGVGTEDQSSGRRTSPAGFATSWSNDADMAANVGKTSADESPARLLVAATLGSDVSGRLRRRLRSSSRFVAVDPDRQLLSDCHSNGRQQTAEHGVDPYRAVRKAGQGSWRRSRMRQRRGIKATLRSVWLYS